MSYTLRDGCEPPVHAKLELEEREHPLYWKYLRYRAAMSAQLVHCQSFKSWLNEYDRSPYDEF